MHGHYKLQHSRFVTDSSEMNALLVLDKIGTFIIDVRLGSKYASE